MATVIFRIRRFSRRVDAKWKSLVNEIKTKSNLFGFIEFFEMPWIFVMRTESVMPSECHA